MQQMRQGRPHLFDPTRAQRIGLINAIVYQEFIQLICTADEMAEIHMILAGNTKAFLFEPADLCKHFVYLDDEQIVAAIEALRELREIVLWQPKSKDSFWVGVPGLNSGG